jgi:hypothetical protein
MTRSIISRFLIGTLSVCVACDAPTPLAPASASRRATTLPADGRGNKEVFAVSIHDEVTCETANLRRDIDGWVQVRFFEQDGNRNVELDVFHGIFTFTNAANESFVWRFVGPSRVWLEGDNLVLFAGSGRSLGHIGTFIINLNTEEVVFSAGPELGIPKDQACALLT